MWLHLCKDRFPHHRKSKLMPRGDGPFQIIEKINDNTYKLDLPSNFGSISASFNVSFDAGSDLRANPFREREDDRT